MRILIFEADTPGGRAFDIALLAAILLSVVAVMLESVASYRDAYGPWLYGIEWVFTILFTAEYLLRLCCVRGPARYARSFFGIVDLLAILPTYLSVLVPGAQSLLVIRGLRLLRIFRVFKLGQFLGEASVLRAALLASRHKVTVFLGTLLVLVTILGTAMHLIEGAEGGFDSIPVSVYWAVVTMTTVGYGDIAPLTPVGKALAAFVMILGYSILAVPTGIVTAEIIESARAEREPTTRSCPHCTTQGHSATALFCQDCGGALSPASAVPPDA